MSIKKDKTGRWLVHIEKKGFKRIRKTFLTKKEAEQFEISVLSAKPVESVNEVTDQRRLAELVTLWFDYHGVNLSDGERRRDKLRVIALELGNPIAANLSIEAVVAWRADKLKKGISKKTCNNFVGYLLALFNTLVKYKVVGSNPLRGIEFIKVHERQLSYLSHGQIDELLQAIRGRCVNQSTYFVTQLCLRTGARWGEAEQLRYKQLHNGIVTFEFTKSKKVRAIPLEAGFYQELKQWTTAINPDDRVFTNCIGSFRRAVSRSGLDLPTGQCSHILRHSFASHFVINGGNILSLQRILGHADITMTMRYAHLAPDHLADAIKFNPVANSQLVVDLVVK